MIVNVPLFITSHRPFGGRKVAILSLMASHSRSNSLAIAVQAITFFAKVRFIDNDLSVKLSIIFSSIYMFYVGTYFGMGIGTNIVIFFFAVIGCFIGLSNKIITSSLIFLSIYFGSLFSQGNGRIYPIIISFFIGLYLAKKISNLVNKSTSNKFIKFFV